MAHDAVELGQGLVLGDGGVLAVSESRVCQLHAQAVIRMRGYLQRDTALFTG